MYRRRLQLVSLAACLTGLAPGSLIARTDSWDRGPEVTLPMVFPVVGRTYWVDTFNPNGIPGRRTHHGQDLMAPKLRPPRRRV